MAKPRHSPALFEVIAHSRPASGPKLGFFHSVTRCFRRNNNNPAAVALPSNTPPAKPAPVAPPIREPEPTPPVMDVDPLPSPRRPLATIDPDRYEITLRLTYTSAIIAAFAVVTLIGAAFLAGRNAQSSAKPQIADQRTDSLRNQTPNPDVVNLQNTAVSIPRSAQPDTTIDTQPGTFDPQQSGQLEQSQPRVAGLNYIVVQSYPEEAMASEAAKVLIDNGIPCSVVHNLPRWSSKNWYTVVGLEGFDRISNSPQYNAYVKKIRDISDKYAKRSSFKAFTPTAYRWGQAG